MSKEIQINLRLSVTNGGYSRSVSQNITVDQAALGAEEEIAVVPTTATAYTFSSVATFGYLYLKNLDSANFITYGTIDGATFTPFGKLKAGEMALLRLNPGTAFAMKADAASVKTNYLVLGD